MKLTKVTALTMIQMSVVYLILERQLVLDLPRPVSSLKSSIDKRHTPTVTGKGQVDQVIGNFRGVICNEQTTKSNRNNMHLQNVIWNGIFGTGNTPNLVGQGCNLALQGSGVCNRDQSREARTMPQSMTREKRQTQSY